jgi:hypothetical protein
MRSTIEKIMGLVTGSDCNIKLKLNLELMERGLDGEGLVDDRVWVIKTHFPERYMSARYGAHRAIMAVRSPMDCITSLFHMIGSGTHDCSIAEEDFAKNLEDWQAWVTQESVLWYEYHKFWLDQKDVPIHIIRYEDLKDRKEDVMIDLMKFMLMVPNIEGTYIEAIIKKSMEVGEGKQVYKPRAGKVGANMKFFTESQLREISIAAGKILKNFGYYHLVEPSQKAEENVPKWIRNYNEKTLQALCKNIQDKKPIGKPIVMNDPNGLLRPGKGTREPRSTGEFTHLRKVCTVVGKSQFSDEAVKEAL